MDKIKKFNIFDQPKKVVSPEGAHIYEWEYLDEDGKIQKDKKNIFEEIQSYLPRVDYKTQIAKGEMELENGGGVYQDFRGIPDNTVDIYDYLNALANLPEEQVAKLLEQVNGGNKESVQGKQTTDSEAVSGGQIDEKDVQGKSANAKVDPDTSGKSKEAGGSK